MAPVSLTRELVANRQSLLAYINALTRDLEATEEIFQEVAVAIVEGSAREGSVQEFLPWAREVARRRVAEYYRKSTRRRRIECPAGELMEAVAEVFQEHEERPETALSRLKVLRECLGSLSARVRRMVDQRYREQRGIHEIAQAHALKPASVSMSLWRAHAALESCMQRKLRLEGAK